MHKKIDSLQALRGLAFIGIFLLHSKAAISWARAGVSLFFVLAGFLSYLNSSVRIFDVSIKNNFLFTRAKIRKLYSLHIVTLCLMFLWITINRIASHNLNLIDLLLEFILNLGLIQSWYPDSNVNVSMNGVAWFLSTMTFLYFIFPYIYNFCKRNKKENVLAISIILLGLQVLSCFIFGKLFGFEKTYFLWFSYCFPVFRSVDFFVGCTMGKILIDQKEMKEINIYSSTIKEIAVIIITIVLGLLSKNIYSNNFLKAIFNWTTIYILIAVMWIYIFYKKKGYITRLLCNKFFVYLGNLSSILFLVHYPITEIIPSIFYHFRFEISHNFMVILEFTLAILTSTVYQYYTKNKRRR